MRVYSRHSGARACKPARLWNPPKVVGQERGTADRYRSEAWIERALVHSSLARIRCPLGDEHLSNVEGDPEEGGVAAGWQAFIRKEMVEAEKGVGSRK